MIRASGPNDRLTGKRLTGKMASGRWLADEMLGRLARYLRFLGEDTEYLRGLTDEELRSIARQGGRTLLTRDRALAARTAGAICLRATDLAGQLREMRAQAPELEFRLRFDRCSRCNGRLVAEPSLTAAAALPAGAADGRWACERCQQRYWDGSHTAAIRRTVARALAGPP